MQQMDQLPDSEEDHIIDEVVSWLALERSLDLESSHCEVIPPMWKNPKNVDHLCTPCQGLPWSNLCEDDLYELKIFEHQHLTLRQTILNAYQGCHLCTLVLSNTVGSDDHQHIETYMIFKLRESINFDAVSLFSWQLTGGIDGERPTYNFSIDWSSWYKNEARYAYRTDPWSTLHPYVFSGSKPPPVTVRQEPSTISCARYWMRECRKHHYLCDASRKASLPSRVIDVDVKGSGRRPFLKISKNEVAHYVALSHTWSSSRSLRLTSRNLEDLQQSIPMEDLSQTFRDAIHITRKLDIQYLWIDSICIMQNSQDDWVKESSRMADVYKGATLTIAAFSPSVGPGACILPYERPLFEMPCMLSSNLLIEGEWYYDKPVNSNTTLSDRGWTLQEEQLSYRILYCDKPFLRWRCLFGEARYDMPNRWKKEMNHFSTMLNSSVGYDVVWNKQHHILWRRLVQDYSCRKLTVQLDKLPAISGLASHFIQILQDLQPDYKEEIKLSSTDYLAGHWKQDLLQTILWTKKHPSKPRTTTDYIAPTWSWASSKHAIKAARAWRMEGEPPEANEYDDTSSFYAWCDKEAILTGKWYARVIHAETTLSTVDPFGRVSAGKLVISGPILDFPWFITERSANISGPTFHGDFSSQSRKIHERDHFVYEVPRENVEDKIPWFVPKMRAKNPRWTQKQLLEKFRLQFPNIKLDVRCYLPFECTVLRINNCEGLLLEPVRQEGGGTVYKRVGVCSVGREWDEKLREHEKEPGYKWVIDVCSWGDWKMDEVTIV